MVSRCRSEIRQARRDRALHRARAKQILRHRVDRRERRDCGSPVQHHGEAVEDEFGHCGLQALRSAMRAAVIVAVVMAMGAAALAAAHLAPAQEWERWRLSENAAW